LENNQTHILIKSRNGDHLHIRRLSKNDVFALQEFNENLSAKTRSQFLPHIYDVKTILQFVERNNKGIDRIYVAFSQKIIVAYFFLWNFNQTFPILGIGITDLFQGKGLGEKMMGILIDDAKNAKKGGVLLTTVPINETAFQLYLKMGFEYLGVTNNMAGDGRIVRERMMYLPLQQNIARPDIHDFKPPVS
jgi:ribosomal protein S18 acetylase RimI-like enzyme